MNTPVHPEEVRGGCGRSTFTVCGCVCVLQARVSRIQQIEKDILRLGAHLQVSSPVR